jgi:shikimate 5-dehydrogenase
MAITYTASTLQPAERPAFYFIGVTTGQSSIRRVFPAWAKALGLGDVQMIGIDLPLHAPREDYRTVVEFLAADPLSLGALVTTHKIDLYREANDIFDEIDPLASLMGEVSCLSKRNRRLIASAKDPFSAGYAIDAFLPAQHFADTGAEVFIMGAGGSAIAIDWYLTRPERGANRPTRITVSNRSHPRLDALNEIHEQASADVPLTLEAAPTPADNDAVARRIPPHSVIINATGLGKDAPGSPFSDEVGFPEGAYVWDLNYRGDLMFLSQARAQEEERRLHVVDGWVYFLHGWTQVITEVFDIEIPVTGPVFDELAAIAAGMR